MERERQQIDSLVNNGYTFDAVSRFPLEQLPKLGVGQADLEGGRDTCSVRLDSTAYAARGIALMAAP